MICFRRISVFGFYVVDRECMSWGFGEVFYVLYGIGFLEG